MIKNVLIGNSTLTDAVVKQSQKDGHTLTIAFSSQKKASRYEPTDIQFLYEYLFLDNIYSTLIQTDTLGQTRPEIAEKFS